jgi:hypothetical protein
MPLMVGEGRSTLPSGKLSDGNKVREYQKKHWESETPVPSLPSGTIGQGTTLKSHKSQLNMNAN